MDFWTPPRFLTIVTELQIAVPLQAQQGPPKRLWFQKSINPLEHTCERRHPAVPRKPQNLMLGKAHVRKSLCLHMKDRYYYSSTAVRVPSLLQFSASTVYKTIQVLCPEDLITWILCNVGPELGYRWSAVEKGLKSNESYERNTLEAVPFQLYLGCTQSLLKVVSNQCFFQTSRPMRASRF